MQASPLLPCTRTPSPVQAPWTSKFYFNLRFYLAPVASCNSPSPPISLLLLSSFSQNKHTLIIRWGQQIHTLLCTEKHLVIYQAGRSLTLFIHCQQAGGEYTYPPALNQYTWTAGASSIRELRQQLSHQALPPWPWILQLPCQNVNKTHINLRVRQKPRNPPRVIASQLHLGQVPL